jgi:hypothetical protein
MMLPPTRWTEPRSSGGGGRVDDPLSALAGGAVAGLVVGTAQALLSRRRLDLRLRVAYALVPTRA